MLSEVSVIIPNYQCGAWLSRTIDSCLQQSEYLKEIIIVDDHSTDNSWEVLSQYQERYPRIIKVYRNLRKGGNNARNYGFSLSAGKYIQWLDADDQLLPGKFEAQLSLFEKIPAADIVYSDWRLETYDEKGDVIRREDKYHSQYTDFLLELLVDNWSPPHNYLLKREIAAKLAAINAWNPETPVLQDREYFTLAAMEGARFYYAAGCFCVYNRWNRNSVSKKNNPQLTIDLLEKFGGRVEENKSLPAEKKRMYKKVLITAAILTRLSGNSMLLKDRQLKFSNIYWPMVHSYKTRIKLLIALTRNLSYSA